VHCTQNTMARPMQYGLPYKCAARLRLQVATSQKFLIRPHPDPVLTPCLACPSYHMLVGAEGVQEQRFRVS
jgi:hypothetical protein